MARLVSLVEKTLGLLPLTPARKDLSWWGRRQGRVVLMGSGAKECHSAKVSLMRYSQASKLYYLWRV